MTPYRDAPPAEPEPPPPRRTMLPTIGDAVAYVAWSLAGLAILAAMLGPIALWFGLAAWAVVTLIYLGARTT